jgi:hypothetical protein
MLLYYMTCDGQCRSKDALRQARLVWDKKVFAFGILCGELRMRRCDVWAVCEVCFRVSKSLEVGLLSECRAVDIG